jgi:hypothetical protein
VLARFHQRSQAWNTRQLEISAPAKERDHAPFRAPKSGRGFANSLKIKLRALFARVLEDAPSPDDTLETRDRRKQVQLLPK